MLFSLKISVFHDFLKKDKNSLLFHDFPGWFQIQGFSWIFHDRWNPVQKLEVKPINISFLMLPM